MSDDTKPDEQDANKPGANPATHPAPLERGPEIGPSTPLDDSGSHPPEAEPKEGEEGDAPEGEEQPA